ncbi:YHYH protein [Reichenbachiella carrageenanivorans]|uniref:YHYH protein n=1 Tax=Reichenbachiella carrageenanivorans TaxID=2979869 RepID=A0ABY6CVI4_9BACT|nr:YHYH protein [Reichenbachiella carrageenanivorans]UXX77916.1 YHYH protein [Reichenbachiella carrageenanivorans]
MKGRNKILTALLFSLVTVIFVRCTEEEPIDETLLSELNIFVQAVASQDGAEGGKSVKFDITLVDDSEKSVINETGTTLSATATFSGTATADDFSSEFIETVSIADGASSTTVELEVLDDSIEEGEETITLTLSAASLGTIEIASATAKVMDNDGDEEEEEEENPTSTVADISILASKFYHSDGVTVTFDDTWVTITSKDLPDHKSMYYSANDPLYEDYSEPNNQDFKKNPGSIGEQNLVFKLPRYPAEASSHAATPMGPMGVTINSVALFNQNAAGDDDIFEELNTFDQYEGHPAGTTYHYHTEPVWLTQHRTGADNEAFIGFLLDGFPVYGTHENGVEVFSKDDGGILDDYHGHFGATDDFPNGIYHYHITVDYPWINEDGFYGTAGTVSK